MPIPFLLLGGATVMTVATKSINKEQKEDINIIYDQIEQIINETNETAHEEMKIFNKSIELNDKEKIGIIEYLIEPFIESFRKIKNCELRDRVKEGEIKQIELLANESGDIKRYNSGAVSKIKNTLKESAIFSVFGIVGLSVGGCVECNRLIEEKKVATGRYEEAKLKQEELLNQIAAVKEIRKQTDEITAVLQFLKKILRKAYAGMENIIKEYGCEYNAYPINTKKKLMVIVDLFGAVNSIIINPIINEDGTFNKNMIDNSMSMMNLIEKNEMLIKGL